MNVRQIVIVGIIASLVMAMWDMVVEAIVPNGAGFFGAPIAIGAVLVRNLQGSGNPIPFDGLAFVLGLMGHMMNAVVLAAVFGLFAARTRLSSGGLIWAGMAWGVIVFVIMWFGVAPIVDPLLHNLNGPVFFVAHLMWGAVLGWVWSRLGSRGQRATDGQMAPA